MELLSRFRGIVLAPEAEWPVIAREPPDWGGLACYVALLAPVPAVAKFIGDVLVGVSTTSGAVRRLPLDVGLINAAVDYAAAVIAVGLVAGVIALLATRFGAKPSCAAAVKVAAYSFTPYWLVGVCAVFPGLRFVSVLGVCGILLARSGVIQVMHCPPDSALRYALAATAAALAIMAGLFVLAAALLARL